MQAATLIGQLHSIVAQAHHSPDSSALQEVFGDRIEAAGKLGLLRPSPRDPLGSLRTETLPIAYTLALVASYADASNYIGAARRIYRAGRHLSDQLATINQHSPRFYPDNWNATIAHQKSIGQLYHTTQTLVDFSCELAIGTARRNQIPATRALLCAATLGLPGQQLILVGLHTLAIDELKERQNLDGIRTLLRAASKCSKRLPAPNYLSSFITNQYIDCLHLFGQQSQNLLEKSLGLPPPPEA